jgi:iron(III) transport system permease protein
MTAAADHLAPLAPARRHRLADPSMILWIAMIAILVFLIASPMVRLVVSSFQDPETGRLTWSNYAEAYGRARHLQALWNTLVFGAGVAVLACLFGVPLAWAISRTDMPAKTFIRLMVFGAFIIPPYLGAIGWILLAGPNSGWLNKVWMALSGAEHGVFNVYSMAGLIVVVAVTSFPYVFVFTSGALDLVSSEMEDAANILGAGTLRTTFRVTLPLVLPAIVGGLIISFLEAIALFGAPALIALPGALPGGIDAALAILRISGAGRAGRRLCDAAAADHHLHVLAAAHACSAGAATPR